MTKPKKQILRSLSAHQLARVEGGAYQVYIQVKGTKQGPYDGETTPPPSGN